jgi:type I site-specific restriction-modification system R (restriction) subunit
MYLDKPMRDHVLLQAIARVNRPYEDQEGRRKTCGFVLDFVGIFDNLEKALAFDSQDVAGVIDDIDVLKERFAEQMEHGRRQYLPMSAGKQGDKAEQIAERFEERQETTQATLEELRKLIEEVRQARQERDASHRSPEAFAVYWLLKRDGVAKADEVAKAAEEAFQEYPHWQTSGHQEQAIRRTFYKALIDAGVDAVVEVCESLLKMLRRALS